MKTVRKWLDFFVVVGLFSFIGLVIAFLLGLFGPSFSSNYVVIDGIGLLFVGLAFGVVAFVVSLLLGRKRS